MSTRTPSPAWWSVAATRAAMHAVPAGPARTRWRRELVSELYGLGPAAQARHTVGVLVRAPALRAAVTSRDRVVEPAEEVAMSKPMKCHMGWHRWHTVSAEDGSGRFRVCRRCHKEDVSGGPGHWAGGIGHAAG